MSLLILIAGCAQSGNRGRSDSWRGEAIGAGALTIEEAQSAVMSLAEVVMFSVAHACDVVIRRAESPEARVMCATMRFGTGLGALSAATAPNIYVGFVDLITLTSLSRISLEEPWTLEVFAEEDRTLLHGAFAEVEAKLWERAALVWTPEQLDELREMMLAWRQANPDRRELSSVRLMEFASSRQIGQGGSISAAPLSLFRVLMMDPAANLSPATRELAESRLLAERLAFFAKRFPVVFGWQIELIGTRSVNSKVATSLLNDGENVINAVNEISSSVERLATSYERTLDEFPGERAAAIDQINQALAERIESLIQKTTDAFSAERQAAVDQMRDSLTESLGASIDRLSERFEAQSAGTLDATSAIMTQQRDQLSQQLDARLAEADAVATRVADRLARNLLLVVVLGAAACVIIMFMYRRIESRFAARR